MSRTCVFVCKQYETTFRQLPNGRFSPNSATTRGSWIKRRIRTESYEKFPYRGSFDPKIQNFEGVKQVPHSEQATLQKDILFIPRCSPRARQFATSGQLFCTTYGCGATGLQFVQFSDFGLFSLYITRKQYLPITNLQPGLHRRMIPIFPCGSRRSKGVPSGSGVFLRLLVGELWTPKLAQIFAYGKWL